MAVLWVTLCALHSEMSFLNLFLTWVTVTSEGNDFSYPLIHWFSSITTFWYNTLFAANFWLRNINIFFVSSSEHIISTKSSSISFHHVNFSVTAAIFLFWEDVFFLFVSVFSLMNSSWSKRNYCENVLYMAKKIISFYYICPFKKILSFFCKCASKCSRNLSFQILNFTT